MAEFKYDNLKEWYTKEEYLNILEKSDIRVEFLNGEIRYMAGGTPRHSLLCNNVGGTFRQLLKGKKCVGYNSDLRIWIESKNSYLMPDTSVVCGKLELSEADKNAVTNPTIVVEVASESSIDYDYGTKLNLYRSLSSLKEYIIVHQKEIKVEVFSRGEKDNSLWLLKTYDTIEAVIALGSINAQLSLAEIYENVIFEEA